MKLLEPKISKCIEYDLLNSYKENNFNNFLYEIGVNENIEIIFSFFSYYKKHKFNIIKVCQMKEEWKNIVNVS